MDMKTNILCGFAVLAAVSLFAAGMNPQAEVKSAAAALAGQDSYSWTATVEVANNSRFRPGPTEGQTQKGGLTCLKMSFGGNESEAVLSGTNGAIKTEDDGWLSLAEAAKDDGGGFNPTVFLARMMENFKLPAAQAAELANETKDLTADTNGISGELTEAGAKSLLTFRGRNRGEGPAVSNAKGSARFWITDGKLSKYQVHVLGTVSFNGNDRDVDRTTTVVIKDVNSTKVVIPDEARKKLQ